MGFIDDKRDIFNQIGALTSVKDNQNLPNPKDSISSINNSKEIVPFLLDLLVVLVGSEVLKSVIGELMTGFIRNVEPTLKAELKKQLVEYNSNDPLPTSFVNNGVSVSASDVDSYQKFKTDPASPTGGLLYNTSTPNFDKQSYDAIQADGTEITFNNTKMNYDSTSDSFNYKPANGSQTIGEYTTDYVDGLTIIDEKEFTSNVINSIFGTINTNQNKTEKQLIFEEKLDKSITKLINEEEDISIKDSELREIELTASNRKKGITTVDLGCGVIDNTVTLESLQNLVNTTTASNDPLTVGNAYLGLAESGFAPANQAQASEDSETIKDGFFKRLINAIVAVLVSAVTTPPQIRALFAITSSFKNNGVPQIGNPIDDIQNRRKLSDCISKKAKSTINEFIFNLVKTQMLALIVPVSKIIIKEKINQYLGILRSLIGFT